MITQDEWSIDLEVYHCQGYESLTLILVLLLHCSMTVLTRCTVARLFLLEP